MGMEIIGFGILALLIFTVGFIAGAKFVASDPGNSQEPARPTYACPYCGTVDDTLHMCKWQNATEVGPNPYMSNVVTRKSETRRG